MVLKLGAWGIKDENDMINVIEAGVDGLTIDFPDKLFAYLKK